LHIGPKAATRLVPRLSPVQYLRPFSSASVAGCRAPRRTCTTCTVSAASSIRKKTR
jgi:hypothetical protein